MPHQIIQGKGEQIWVVDDDEAICKMTATLLRKNNYIVSEATRHQ